MVLRHRSHVGLAFTVVVDLMNVSHVLAVTTVAAMPRPQMKCLAEVETGDIHPIRPVFALQELFAWIE